MKKQAVMDLFLVISATWILYLFLEILREGRVYPFSGPIALLTVFIVGVGLLATGYVSIAHRRVNYFRRHLAVDVCLLGCGGGFLSIVAMVLIHILVFRATIGSFFGHEPNILILSVETGLLALFVLIGLVNLAIDIRIFAGLFRKKIP